MEALLYIFVLKANILMQNGDYNCVKLTGTASYLSIVYYISRASGNGLASRANARPIILPSTWLGQVYYLVV